MWPKWYLKVLSAPFRFVRKALHDLTLTMYDDFNFRYMSAPRVWGWLAAISVTVAWIAEQFYGLKFSGWSQLVTWACACLGAYAAKKYADRGGSCQQQKQNDPVCNDPVKKNDGVTGDEKNP